MSLSLDYKTVHRKIYKWGIFSCGKPLHSAGTANAYFSLQCAKDACPDGLDTYIISEYIQLPQASELLCYVYIYILHNIYMPCVRCEGCCEGSPYLSQHLDGCQMTEQCYRMGFTCEGEDIPRQILQLYASITKYFGLLDLDVQHFLKHHNFDVIGHCRDMDVYQDVPKLYTQLFSQSNILLVYLINI